MQVIYQGDIGNLTNNKGKS